MKSGQKCKVPKGHSLLRYCSMMHDKDFSISNQFGVDVSHQYRICTCTAIFPAVSFQMQLEGYSGKYGSTYVHLCDIDMKHPQQIDWDNVLLIGI